MTGYADDLGLGSGPSLGYSAIQNNQRVVNSLNVWLEWSRMKAKPKKCVAMAILRGQVEDPRLTIQVDGVSFPMAFTLRLHQANILTQPAGLEGLCRYQSSISFQNFDFLPPALTSAMRNYVFHGEVGCAGDDRQG